MNIKSVSFTLKGDEINKRLKAVFADDIECFGKGFNIRKENIYEWTKNNFKSSLIIFIGSLGIAVRAISKCINSKDKDCAVICIDELGRFVIPVLCGHIGGANEYACILAEKLGAVPVITTATDINNVFAFDSFAAKNDIAIGDIKTIKNISSALLEGRSIGIKSDFELINIPQNVYEGDYENGVLISVHNEKPFKNTLHLIPKCVYIGIGCRKNADYENVKRLFDGIMKECNINPKSVKAVCTIDIKKNEKAVLRLCGDLGVPLKTFSAEELNSVQGDFTGSDFVKRITGSDNVCERSAVKASEGEIIVRKASYNAVTMAAALKKRRIDFEYNGIGDRL